jgi:hypothetical protein
VDPSQPFSDNEDRGGQQKDGYPEFRAHKPKACHSLQS